jgi:hypothetical protein
VRACACVYVRTHARVDVFIDSVYKTGLSNVRLNPWEMKLHFTNFLSVNDFRIQHSFRKRRNGGFSPCTYVARGTQQVALFNLDYFLAIEDRAEYQYKFTRI